MCTRYEAWVNVSEHTRLAASRQTGEKLSVGALVGLEIEEAAHANRKARKSMTNRVIDVVDVEFPYQTPRH